MRPQARSRDGYRGHRKQARVEPERRHRRGQPQRGGQVRRRLAGRQPGHPGEPAQPPVTASSTARQSPDGDPDGASGRAASSPETCGSSPASRSRSTPARDANRDRHDRAVDAGTIRRPPPGAAAHGRAAARPAAAASAPSTSTVMITSAPYRRRDHRTARSSTCVRPHERHRPRRGRNGTHPSGIAISRHRANPHLASTAAARAAQHARRQPRLDTFRRTSYRHHQVPPPAPPGGLPRSHGQAITGRAAATAYTATVTPSTSPRNTRPPDNPRTTQPATPTPSPWPRSTARNTGVRTYAAAPSTRPARSSVAKAG